MNLLRVLVRPMLAAPFVVEGVDAIARPARHVERLQKVTPALERAGVPPLLTSDARLLTRVTGAVSVLAGLGLATGRAPRTSAAVLAALNLPLTLVRNPVWAAGDANDADNADNSDNRDSRRRAASGLLRGAAVGGGLLLASVDRQGRPSLAWQLRNSRQQREAIEAAHMAVRKRYGVAPA